MCKVTGTVKTHQQQDNDFVNNMCYEYFYKGQCNSATCKYVHAKVKDGVEVKQHRPEQQQHMAAGAYGYLPMAHAYDPATMGMAATPGQPSVECLQLQQQQFVSALMQLGVTAEVIQTAAMASGMQMNFAPAQPMMAASAYGGMAYQQQMPQQAAQGPDFIQDMCYEYFYKGECNDANCTYVHAKVKDGVPVKQQRPEVAGQLQARQHQSAGGDGNVLCSKHDKKRSMRNMANMGGDVWECRSNAPCKGGGL